LFRLEAFLITITVPAERTADRLFVYVLEVGQSGMPRMEIRLCRGTVRQVRVWRSQMDLIRPRFGDKTEESHDALGEVEQRAAIYQRGLSAALAGLPHQMTDDPWYDAGWRHGARISALRTRKLSK